MTIDLDQLEVTAKAATPGPWTHGEKAYLWLGDERNQLYIAAANPDVVLELIAELQQTRRERDWLASQRYPQGPGDTRGCPSLERYSKCDNVGSCGVHSHKKCRECWLNAAKKRKLKR